MDRIRLRCAKTLLLCAAVALSLPVLAANYDFEIVDYPGAQETSLWGANDRGQVVGFADLDDVNSVAFVYDQRTKVFTLLPGAPGSSQTSPTGINDAGLITGMTWVDPEPFFTPHGFIRNKNGTYSIIRNPDWDSHEVLAVNDQGLVIGDYISSATFLGAGFVLDRKTGTSTDIRPDGLNTSGDFRGYGTIPWGINSKGQIVGTSIFYDNELPAGSVSFSEMMGFLRQPDGSIKAFRVNHLNTRARAMSDSGVIVGYVFDFREPSKRAVFAIKLRATPVFEDVTVAESDLVRAPGYRVLIPHGVANDGTIIGTAVSDIDRLSHGFVATPQLPLGP